MFFVNFVRIRFDILIFSLSVLYIKFKNYYMIPLFEGKKKKKTKSFEPTFLVANFILTKKNGIISVKNLQIRKSVLM